MLTRLRPQLRPRPVTVTALPRATITYRAAQLKAGARA